MLPEQAVLFSDNIACSFPSPLGGSWYHVLCYNVEFACYFVVTTITFVMLMIVGNIMRFGIVSYRLVCLTINISVTIS